jgi:CRP-like cAMP-binding protein
MAVEDMASKREAGRFRNSILRGLPEDLQKFFWQHATVMEVNAGDVLYRRYENIQFVYFPESAIVSLLITTVNGQSSGVALTGSEGIVGFPLLLGQQRAGHEARVQNAGYILRVERQVFADALVTCKEFHDSAMEFMRSLVAQMQTGMLCSQHFEVKEQLARWLLLTFERAESNELSITQQTLADMLGVSRESVNEAAQSLYGRQLIAYRRGWIQLLDQGGLRQLVKDCYPDSESV